MAAAIPPDITNEPLAGLLQEVHDGRVQVPEFQRAVTWDDDGIKLLLASVSLNYPIGAVKLLQAGSVDVRFDSRPVAGAPTSSTAPERLLVDGQPRIAALYQVLVSGRVVPTDDANEQRTHRWYYIDIEAALDPGTDRDDAIVSLAESREELEWEQCLFPLRLVFGAKSERRRWQQSFATYPVEGRASLMDRFEREVLAAFRSYLVPTINVGRELTRWAVRVHGGRDGRMLSDRFRVAAREDRLS